MYVYSSESYKPEHEPYPVDISHRQGNNYLYGIIFMCLLILYNKLPTSVGVLNIIKNLIYSPTIV